MNPPTPVTMPPDPSQVQLQQLIQDLEAELAAGPVQLPGFPEVVLRVQRVLNDDLADVDQIAQAVSVEPALAMQILRIGNAAAYNTTSRQVREVRMAIQRIGSRMVRAAAVSFAVQQLREAEALRAVRDRLQVLWRRGLVVGAIARALSAQLRVSTPDNALLAGLLHVVGRLFILTRLNRAPRLLDQPGMPEQVLDAYGARFGAVLLAAWEVPDEFRRSIAEFNDPARVVAGKPGLADLLSAAVILADLLPASRTDYLDQMQLAQVFQQTEGVWQHLGLNRENCSDALHIALEDVQQLRAMFGA
jgi:HD-like signal output (HDOD) protein